MPTCESTTFADVAIMVIQFAAIIFGLLIAMGFIQRGLKALVDWVWRVILRQFQKEQSE